MAQLYYLMWEEYGAGHFPCECTYVRNHWNGRTYTQKMILKDIVCLCVVLLWLFYLGENKCDCPQKKKSRAV